jgi:two-component system nitrate/nitrite response regulator NarL
MNTKSIELELGHDGAEADATPRNHDAAERLVRELVASAPSRAGESPASDVLFTLSIDGVRCVLVKEAPSHPAQPAPAGPALSPREQEIASLIAKGHSNKTVATVLDISPWTVGTHLRRIFTKLGVSSRTAMVRWVLEQDLSRARLSERR